MPVQIAQGIEHCFEGNLADYVPHQQSLPDLSPRCGSQRVHNLMGQQHLLTIRRKRHAANVVGRQVPHRCELSRMRVDESQFASEGPRRQQPIPFRQHQLLAGSERESDDLLGDQSQTLR